MRATSASLMPLTSRREQRIACGAPAGVEALRLGRRSAWSGPVVSSSLRAKERFARAGWLSDAGRGGRLRCAPGPAGTLGEKWGDGAEPADVLDDGVVSALQSPAEALTSTGRTWTPDR